MLISEVNIACSQPKWTNRMIQKKKYLIAMFDFGNKYAACHASAHPEWTIELNQNNQLIPLITYEFICNLLMIH